MMGGGGGARDEKGRDRGREREGEEATGGRGVDSEWGEGDKKWKVRRE